MVHDISDFTPSPSKKHLDPIAALLYADSYGEYLGETPWYSVGNCEYSFEDPMVRSLSEIACHLNPETRIRILEELRAR